ncbi:MAG: HAMP domain-containing sensor histidine kinase [Acidimicrobiia bacterium]|nr:HAMP domain-containing sensor histidine kinase [Acidimicrobiia bacterium]
MGSTKVSRVWSAAAVVAFALAAILAGAAIRHQELASRPIGEGELFREDAGRAVRIVDEAADAPARTVRNVLELEAAAMIDAAGNVAETSASALDGRALDGFLGSLHARRAFGAIAAPVPVDVAIDGVPTWPAGSVLYQVLTPLPDGRSVLLVYDVAELLHRRAAAQGVRPATIQLGIGAVVAVLAGFLLVLARAGANRRLAVATRERELLEARQEELREHNRVLSDARRRAEDALALAEEKNRIRTEFVLMINHELRTPLTSLLTGTELLAAGVEGADANVLIDDMRADGDRLLGLIDHMLAVARIENRGLDYTLRPVDPHDVAADLERVPSIDKVVLHRDDALRTDRAGLVALVTSLADNAVQHGATDVLVEVGVTTPMAVATSVGSPPVDAVTVDIVDDGPGIAEGFVERLFEKFEKDSFSSGTGLGLYVARLMAEALEGSIAVETGPLGSRFRIFVPAAGVSP